VGEPSERLVMASSKALAEEFFALVVACGFWHAQPPLTCTN